MSAASSGEKEDVPVPPPLKGGGAWGTRGGPVGRLPMTGSSPTYSSITSINTSVNDKKNIVEVRLEKQQGASFNLNDRN